MAGAGGELLVGAGLVVTDEAVDQLGVLEIETGVLPPVARVAAGAAGPVAIQVDTEVVDGGGLLAKIDALFVSYRVGRGAMPVPMGGLQNGLALFFMAG